jgi:copper(I)-binding protein
MITRRALISTGLACLFAGATARAVFAEPASAGDPLAIVTAIYTRAAKGKGNGGGGFVIENKAAKAKYLSKSLIALWAKADAHTIRSPIRRIRR